MVRADILIVDDNPGDAMLLQEAFQDRCSKVSLRFASDGIEALSILRREGSMPDLIVLDIKMPGMDGLEFLRVVGGDPALRDASIIVLTGSNAPEDYRAARQLGALDYFTKPIRLEGWTALSLKLEKLAFTYN